MKKNAVTVKIQTELYELRDLKYRDFQAKLIPTVKSESIIGVRTPALRNLAKRYVKDLGIKSFLNDLPHKFFDENQLHAFIISEIKDYSFCIAELEMFLPFIDNWATCDQLSPKVFKKHKPELKTDIDRWLNSDLTYTVRFGIETVMQHFLDSDYDKNYLERIASVKSDDYYVKMMIAWFFATALAKQYSDAVKYIEDSRLDKWVHNKTIQKAVESYRITAQQKDYLRKLRIK